MEEYFSNYASGFLEEVASQSFKAHPTNVESHVRDDCVNTYRLNSDGYRSDEFTADPKLVVAGCSFTFGSGVAENRSWGSLAAKELDLPLTNLGVCAWSTQAIIYNLFAYFKKYGHPEYLLCLFPDDSRAVLPVVRGFVEHEDWDNVEQADFRMLNLMIPLRTETKGRPYSDRSKFSKQPHDWEQILPVELIMHQYFQNIHMLQSYCKVAGIKLFWSTWFKPLADMLEAKIGDEYMYNYYGLDTYIPLHASSWDWDYSNYGGGMTSEHAEKSKQSGISCHLDLKESDGDNFYIGSDSAGLLHHWGSHKHAHIAEKFIEKLKDEQNLAE